MDTPCYPVLSVVTPASILERKGSREKFWVAIEADEIPWLLKFPRPGTGEHWAEKVAAEVGNLIGVDCARVELARCVGVQSAFGQTRDQQQGQWNNFRGNSLQVLRCTCGRISRRLGIAMRIFSWLRCPGYVA